MKIDDSFILHQSDKRINKLMRRLRNLKMNKKLESSILRSLKKEVGFNDFLLRKIAEEEVSKDEAIN